MSIQLKIARSTVEKDQVYQLRSKVFIEEEKRFDLSTEHIYDRFDSFNETSNFLAFSDNSPVAGIRLVLDNPVGLPAEEAFDFGPLRQSLSGGCATVGWFCIRKQFRRHPGLVVSLIQMCFRKMRQHGARHVLAVMYPPALPLLSRLVGAQPLGPEIMDHALGVGIVPVHVDLENLPMGSRERFLDPDEHLFEDSAERRLFRRDETIVSHGDSDHHVYQIMRGVVRAHRPVEGAHRSAGSEDKEAFTLLLGPGQIFGELSALDGRGANQTMVAHSEDVDVMVWPRQSFTDQMYASPERMMRLCRMMAESLRRTYEQPEADPSAALAARLLVGASGQGRRPVDARWLAGQCGLDRQTFTRVVLPWEAEHVIEADEKNKRIWVIDGGRLAREARL